MTYKLSKNIQLQLLALVMRESNYNVIKNIVDPEDFTLLIQQKFCRFLASYRNKFPDDKVIKSGFLQFIRENLKKRNKLDELVDYSDLIDKVSRISLANKTQIKQIALDHAKKVRFEATLDEGVNQDGTWNYDYVWKRFKEIQSLGLLEIEKGHLLFGNASERLKWYKEVKEAPFKTGYQFIDERLDLGGIYGGELITFLAAPGIGKSLILSSIAHNQIMKYGRNCVFFALEMKSMKVARRIDSKISGLRKDEFITALPALQQALRNAKKEANKADLDIKQFPTKTCTVEMIDAYLEFKYTEDGFLPDGGIVVDYLNIMKSSKDKADKYEQLESNAEELRRLAEKWDVPVYTAVQGNRESLQKRILDLDDLAGSFAPVFVADVVIPIAQTREEMKKFDKESYQKVRLILAKNREEVSGVVIHCLWNKSIGDLKLDPDKKTVNDIGKKIVDRDSSSLIPSKVRRRKIVNRSIIDDDEED